MSLEVGERSRRSGIFNDQKLKLGVFGINASGGMTMTEAPRTYEVTWDHSRSIARLADQIGFELLLPLARWKGFGGKTNFNGRCFETFTWAAGIAEATEKITVMTTCHIPTIHPIVAAKMASTVDHISGGRFGLNVVMGWFGPEFEMFGIEQRAHDARYASGAEWLDIVQKLWSEDRTDFDGEYYRIADGFSDPKPMQGGRPVLVNAGNSPAGIDFSARYVDFNFMSYDTVENAAKTASALKSKGAEYGRTLGSLTYALVVCRDTEAEANHAYHEALRLGDREGAENLMKVLGLQSASFAPQVEKFRDRFITGWGGKPLVGTPEMVADELLKLSNAGVDGIVFGFLDYLEDLAHFNERVMPLLKQAGLRH